MIVRALTAPVFLSLALSAPAAQATHPGEEPYRRFCFICHDRGVQVTVARGAPRLGDQRAWESRRRQGINVLYSRIAHTTYGQFQMPLGGFTEDEVKAAIAFMLMSADY